MDQFSPVHLIIAFTAAIIIGAWALSFLRKSASNQQILMPSGDATRLVLGSLVLNGALFRRTILNNFKNPYRAKSPEFGLDLHLIIKVCQKLENEERLFQWAVIFLAFALIIFRGISEYIAGILLFSLIVAILIRNRFVLSRQFRRDHYNLADLRRRYGLGEVDNQLGEIKVVCSGLADPFIGMGTNSDAWNLAFDISRAAPGNKLRVPSITPSEVEDAISHGLRRLELINLTIDNMLFVSGVETVHVPGLHSNLVSAPLSSVQQSVAIPFAHTADPRARMYKVAQVKDWSGELVLSFLFRCVKRGELLTVEAVSLALPPIADAFRNIDRLEILTVWELFKWGAGAIVSMPFVLLGAAFSVMGQVSEVIDHILGGVEARERQAIRKNPVYNYGAVWSLRSHIAARSFSSWFQKADARQYFRALTEQVLNALRDALDDAGVDTASLNAQSLTIQNNNVHISANQDVTIQGMAVGANANARVSGINSNPVRS